MFLSRNKKNNVYPCKPQFYYIKVRLRGYIGMFLWYNADTNADADAVATVIALPVLWYKSAKNCTAHYKKCLFKYIANFASKN